MHTKAIHAEAAYKLLRTERAASPASRTNAVRSAPVKFTDRIASACMGAWNLTVLPRRSSVEAPLALINVMTTYIRQRLTHMR